MGLVVVSGAPGTGKSTVAAALGAALRRPVLSLDPMKEALADVLGLGGEAWSDRLGDAAAELIFRLAPAFPQAVAEGWWRGTRRDRALVEFAGGVEVFCHCTPPVALARMRARHGVDRHPVHRDVINPSILDRVASAAAEVTPLGLGGDLVVVDTEQPDAAAAAVARVAEVLRG